MTANLFLERTFGEPLTPAGVADGARASAWCLDLHKVQWQGSFLSLDGHTMICSFSAPDLESGRLALRNPDVDLSRFWAGTVHSSPNTAVPNVAVERSFPTPVRFEDMAARGGAKPWCFEMHHVAHTHSFFSLDGTRMICFFAAPDAEAVRATQREVGVPVTSIWPGSAVGPSTR